MRTKSMRKVFKRFTATALFITGLGLAVTSYACSHTNHNADSSATTTEVAATAVANAEEPTAEEHGDHAHQKSSGSSHGDGHGEHDHHHRALEVPANQPTPTVALAVEPDPVTGWNIEVRTENWTFAPERVNQDSVTTEGHAHLYLNGEKITRIYSQWYYQPSLPSGEHTLTVGLNANGHEALTHNNEPIEASVRISVP